MPKDKERRRAAAIGRASASTTPRSADSLSLLTRNESDYAAVATEQQPTAAATPSVSSVPRSRKKLKHRSSLEFLQGDTDASEGNAAGANDTSASSSSRRKRKSLPPVTPVNIADDTQPNTNNKYQHQKRQMSPESKSKLEKLSNKRTPRSADSQEANNGTRKIALGKKISKKSIYEAENRSKKSTKTKNNGDSDSKHKSRVLLSNETSSMQQNHGPESTTNSKPKPAKKSELDDHVTPKTNRANKIIKHSIHTKPYEESYSPLDYRPENTNVAPAAATPMLETYVEQWAKPSPSDKNLSEQRMDEDRKKKSKYSNHSANVDNNSDEMVDDPSSSVVSTSSNSENIDEGLEEYDGTMVKSNQHMALDNGSNLTSSLTPALQLNQSQSLETEYGRLAYMKRELEQKMQLHKLDAQKINPWMLNMEQHQATNPTSLMTNHHSLTNAVGGTEGLGMIDHNNFSTKSCENPNNVAAASGQIVALGRDNVSLPTREDVAYGEMIYQQTMKARQQQEQQHLAANERGGRTRDDSFGIGRHRGGRSGTSRYGTGPRQHEDDEEISYGSEDDYYHRAHKMASTRPTASSREPAKRKKKKRKRRVVETITRVIHEESEEDGSASTSKGKHEKQPFIDGYVADSRRYHGNDRYHAKESKMDRSEKGYGRGRSHSTGQDTYAASHRRGGSDYYTTQHDEESEEDSFISQQNGYSDRRRLHSPNHKRRRSGASDNEKWSGHKKSTSEKKKKQQKRNQGRVHTSQKQSMLESLH